MLIDLIYRAAPSDSGQKTIGRFLIVLCALVFALVAEVRATPVFGVTQFAMHEGDIKDWANPRLDDAGWPPVAFHDLPDSAEILILRAGVDLSALQVEQGQPTGLIVAAMAACEVAWDGVVIVRNGKPARTAEGEIPGAVQGLWQVPDRLLSDGTHNLALRCSAHHRHFKPTNGYWGVWVGDYRVLAEYLGSSMTAALSSLIGMLMVGVFALVMYVVDRRERAFLLLGLVCIAGAALLLAESWRSWFGYTYNWHLLRLVAVTGLAALLNIALLAFVQVRFSGRAGRWYWLTLGLGVVLGLIVPYWDGKSVVMFLFGLSLCTIWVTRAAWQRQRGSLPALLGFGLTLGTLLWSPFQFADLNLYLALDALLLCLLIAHALQVHHDRRAHEAALVKSARLEVELLRKHIQPHFLMNTLTALSEWIESEPAVAVEMIDSISAEFRILARIADRPLISLGEELDLCQTHVEIMSRRRDREYRLRSEGVDRTEQVPPAIIHTLVENAISHDAGGAKRIELRLIGSHQGEQRRYRFVGPANPEPVRAAAVDEGTGFSYIRARLRESYGDAWSLRYGPCADGWETEIVIGEPA